MSSVGRVSRGIARNFGLVGVGARACGIEYDARLWSPSMPGFQPIVEKTGDVLARAKVRTREIFASLSAIETLAQESSEDPPYLKMPEQLPANAIGMAIVEGHRGELIHLAFTDADGNISRYAMKDASVNNWTALPIAIRNNLVADFPLCNKSFSLAYSGHDL
jgi:Ni,Fe-hydrogenase III large subunit